MLENQSVPTSPEISPVSPSPTPINGNDNGGKESDSVQSSLFEKIGEKAGRLFEKHGITFKRGRGRPRKDGSPKATDIPLQTGSPSPTPPTPLAVPADPAPPFDSNIVKRCVSAVFKGVKAFLDGKLFSKAIKVTGDSKFARDLVTETTVQDGEIEAFTELAEVCLRKYGVGTEYCPEVGLLAIAGVIGLRYTVAMKTLDAKIVEKQARGN